MLVIMVPGQEMYDASKNLFTTYKDTFLSLEHSLVSISKWESKWHKPFYSNKEKTKEEVKDYIRCMTVGSISDEFVYDRLTDENVKAINEYILDPMTATTINEQKKKPSREILTSEVFYYLMVAYNIPFECQKWHINRLMTLIKICEIKNAPPKKMSKSEILRQNHSLNAARRAALHSRG